MNKPLHVILQSEIFGYENRLMIKALVENRMPFSIVNSLPIINTKEYSYVVRGSVEFVLSFIEKYGDKVFILPLTINNYRCNHYYQHTSRLLNKDFVLVPWGKLEESKEFLFDRFRGNRLFIRPNSGYKIFTGTSLGRKWFSKELEIIKNLPSSINLHDNELVLVSSYKEIVAEYRAVIANGRLLDYTIYNGDEDVLGRDNEMIKKLVKSLAYSPDPWYTVDIARTASGRYYILELNSFCSAGLYDMNYDLIVKTLHKTGV